MNRLFLTLALACIGFSANAQEIRRSWSGELETMGQKLVWREMDGLMIIVLLMQHSFWMVTTRTLPQILLICYSSVI